MAKAIMAAKAGLTITEALAEIKTVTKRILAKRASISPYLVRDSRAKDPLETEGGSREFIKRERQAISDLENRIVKIKVAISTANLETDLKIGDQQMTVFEWLTWRREISEGSITFLKGVSGGIMKLRADIQKAGRGITTNDNDADVKRGDAIVQIDERALIEEIEQKEAVLGELDGRLSLLNATTVVKI